MRTTTARSVSRFPRSPRCASLLLALACGCAHGSASEPERIGPQPIGDPALAHVRELVAFGPRPAGSESLRKAGDYIAAELTKLSIPIEFDTWQDHGLSYRNVIARIPPAGEFVDPPIVLLGTHYDTKKFSGHADPAFNFRFVGANDGGSGTGLLLALASRIRAQPGRTAEVWLLFFDGEESQDPGPGGWQTGHPLAGSTRTVQRLNRDWLAARKRVTALVLLDMVGSKDLTIDCELGSHPKLRDLVREEANRLGHAASFAKEVDGNYVEDDHLPFVKTGIPAIDLIDFKQRTPADGQPGDAVCWWHTPFDDLPILSARSLQIVGEVVLAVLPRLASFKG